MKKSTGLASLGAAAIVAGCGGGGGGSAQGGVVPPGHPYNGPMGTATVKVAIPARGAQTRRQRGAKWVSPSSTTLGIRVLASPMPNPTPTEDVVNIPSPGPVPTSFAVTVQAPLSNDTFVASVYDSAHNLLATGSSAPIQVTLNSTPPVSLSMLGVAGGIQYAVAGGTPAAWRVLENMGVAQTASVSAQPVDADGNLIPGSLALPVAVTGNGGVTVSPATVTGPTTLTATYPSNTVGAGSISSPLALNAGASSLNVAVNADYYMFVANDDGSNYVIDGLTQTQVGTPATGYANGTKQVAALSGCATGAFAIAGNSNGGFEFSVAAPTIAIPNPLPTVTSLPGALLASAPVQSGATADAQCNAYYDDVNSGFPLIRLSGFDSSLAANTSFASGFQFASTANLEYLGGQIIQVGSPGPSLFQEASVAPGTGGLALLSSQYTITNGNPINVPVAGAGTTIYFVANTCGGQPVIQPLTGGSQITLTNFSTVSAVAQANDGTAYIVGDSSATGTPAVLAYASLGSIVTAPTVALGAGPVGIAVTPDQQYVCVLESPAGTSGQIEVYNRSTLALVKTVPLSSSALPDSFSIGP